MKELIIVTRVILHTIYRNITLLFIVTHKTTSKKFWNDGKMEKSTSSSSGKLQAKTWNREKLSHRITQILFMCFEFLRELQSVTRLGNRKYF